MRASLLMGLTALICLLCPVNPRLGLYGYYWFALLRPDVLAWSGPNNYSFAIAIFAIFSNIPRVIQNTAVLATNPICRKFILFIVLITISVIFAVNPALCVGQYVLFLKMAFMAMLIPLALTTFNDLKILVLVSAASIGLLGAKFGLYGVIAGGARYAVGYGGMLNDNNTIGLAFAIAVPMCWFARLLVRSAVWRLSLIGLALLSMAAVVFTHSRGAALSVGVALLLIALKSKHKLALGLILVMFAGGAAYLVKDSYTARLGTISSPTEEASAKSRIVLAKAAVSMWLDYPIFGVGFTEQNAQALIVKYVPDEYKADYDGKVIHNTYLQLLVDSGAFALLLYLWMIAETLLRMRSSEKRAIARGDPEGAAIPAGIEVSLIACVIGSTFLSRTSFDLFYILLMMAAAWLEVERKSQFTPAAAVVTPEETAAAPAPSLAVSSRHPWLTDRRDEGRVRMTRKRGGRPGEDR